MIFDRGYDDNKIIDYVEETYDFEVEKVALDSDYGTLEIKKKLIDKGIFGVIGYRYAMHRWLKKNQHYTC